MQSLELLSGTTLTPDDSYLLRVVPELCAEGGILFGGWAMAAMVEVAQAWSGRRVRPVDRLHGVKPTAPLRQVEKL